MPGKYTRLGRSAARGLGASHLLGTLHGGRASANAIPDSAPDRLQPPAGVSSAISSASACSADRSHNAACWVDTPAVDVLPNHAVAGARRARGGDCGLQVLRQAAPVPKRVLVFDVPSHGGDDRARGQLELGLRHGTPHDDP